MTACQSGRHTFIDAARARHCCHPEWRQVLVTAQELQEPNANFAGVSQTAVLGMWRAYVPRTNEG